MKKYGKYGKYAGIGIFWIGLWQLAYLAVGRDFIVPSPLSVLSAFIGLLTTQSFYANVAATMVRVLSGIVLSFGAGLITAVASYFFPTLRELLKLPVNVLKATPVMAVVLFAILWLTAGLVPVFVCFLVCYPVCYTNMLSGMDRLESEYLELCQIYGVRRRDQLWGMYLPGILPEIQSALSLSTGLSWKSVVAAEVLAVAPYSMGYHLMLAKSYLETDQLFAWTGGIILFSILFEWAAREIIRRAVRQS